MILARLKLYGALALVVAVLGLGLSYRASLIREGELRAENRQLDSTIKAVKLQIVRSDTVWKHDTLYLARTITRQDTLRDTLVKHLTDTVLVLRYIAATDSTIKACRLVVQDCTERVALRDQEIDALNRKLAMATSNHSSRVRPFVLGALTGAVAVVGTLHFVK